MHLQICFVISAQVFFYMLESRHCSNLPTITISGKLPPVFTLHCYRIMEVSHICRPFLDFRWFSHTSLVCVQQHWGVYRRGTGLFSRWRLWSTERLNSQLESSLRDGRSSSHPSRIPGPQRQDSTPRSCQKRGLCRCSVLCLHFCSIGYLSGLLRRYCQDLYLLRAPQAVLEVKNPPANVGDKREAGLITGSGRSPGGGQWQPTPITAWRIPWTEEPGGLPSMGSHRVGHDWHDLAGFHCLLILQKAGVISETLPSHFTFCNFSIQLLYCQRFYNLGGQESWKDSLQGVRILVPGGPVGAGAEGAPHACSTFWAEARNKGSLKNWVFKYKN